MAKLVPFPPAVELNDEHLELTERACRINAKRCRRKGAIGEAEHWESVADNLARVLSHDPGPRAKTLADLGGKHRLSPRQPLLTLEFPI